MFFVFNLSGFVFSSEQNLLTAYFLLGSNVVLQTGDRPDGTHMHFVHRCLACADLRLCFSASMFVSFYNS